MVFSTQAFALATLASTLVSALPLDTSQARNIVPRAKSYSVVNVGGGASTEAPAAATTTADATTKTVDGPTVTAKVTTTIVGPVPAPVATSTSSSTSSRTPSRSPTSKATTTSPPTTATATPTPVFVTVTVTDDAGPTEYYDNGMWHTWYRIKTFEAIAAPTLLNE
ncbi:uncharacterized protein M421DRAFT_416496 [Didymella exigua CBS 183.55]|uniref:Uncharacterized protein n=1 Tax=Didymella exigua CBS 183.55 TaxID=1150837 RepID=A0A6A5RZ69_9PLEO|nr:uncharacterized protein M421DRAFT_416496 [Didymella exigua CBS 183.55]KAF1932903.1 hypothetical protein M421DRAFT_416496 [Didymella exigua CBS 183.55]